MINKFEEPSENYYNVDQNRKQHHNALERQRRGVLKFSFQELRSIIPLCGDKTSRATILNKSCEYVTYLITSGQRLDDYINRYHDLLEFLDSQVDLINNGDIDNLSSDLKRICVNNIEEINALAVEDIDPCLGFIEKQYSSSHNRISSTNSPLNPNTSQMSSDDEESEAYHIHTVSDLVDEYVFVDKNSSDRDIKPDFSQNNRL